MERRSVSGILFENDSNCFENIIPWASIEGNIVKKVDNNWLDNVKE